MQEDYVDFYKLYFERHGIHDLYESICNRLILEQPKAADVTSTIIGAVKEIRTERFEPRTSVIFVLAHSSVAPSTCEMVSKIAKELGYGYVDSAEFVSMHPRDAASGLRTAISRTGHSTVVVTGFPPTMSHAIRFECGVFHPKMVVYAKVDEDWIAAASASNSGGAVTVDEAFASICATVNPLAEYYSAVGKLQEVDSTKSADEVATAFREKLALV